MVSIGCLRTNKTADLITLKVRTQTETKRECATGCFHPFILLSHQFYFYDRVNFDSLNNTCSFYAKAKPLKVTAVRLEGKENINQRGYYAKEKHSQFSSCIVATLDPIKDNYKDSDFTLINSNHQLKTWPH